MSVLLGAIRGQRRLVVTAAALHAGHQAGEALVPVLIGVVIDRAIAADGYGVLIIWLAILAAVFAALSYGFRFGARAGERAAEQAAHELRMALTTRVLDPRGGAETGRLPGTLASLASGDAQQVGALNRALPYGIAALTGLVVTAVALLRMSVPLGLLVLLGTPPLLWLAHLLGRPLERRSEAERERAAHASGVAADLVAGLRVLKGLRAEPVAVARYRRTSQESLHATVRAARAQAWHDGGMLALNGIFLAVVALVGGRLAAQGEITVGELVAAVGLAQFLLGPLTLFAWVNGDFAQARASARRIADVLASPPAERPAPSTDLRVAPGELLGVVTPDPAAATALLDGLGGPDVLIAAHDAHLFEGTVRDNVAAAATIEPERALAAAQALSLPDGLLTERGRSLSGGQRQRVALARALAADPPVLVLHDPTTAVDAVTEAAIATGIRDLRRGRTTILVTTSPALLAVAGRVVVIEDGAITAEGTHAELSGVHAGYRTAVLA